MLKGFVDAYFQQLTESFSKIPFDKIERVVEMLFEAYHQNKHIFVFGNGGSASIASHFCCDLGKGAAAGGRRRFRIISLNDNIPLMTAYSNDCGYDHIFVEQLRSLLCEGDLVICITGSGRSQNVLNAIDYANKAGAKTIGFLGFGGGAAKDMVDEHIAVNNENHAQIEDVHMALAHAISQYFKRRFEDDPVD